jgi:hypothetical protein
MSLTAARVQAGRLACRLLVLLWFEERGEVGERRFF